MKKKKQKPKGFTEHLTRMGFHVVRLHYSADPLKNPKSRAGKKWLRSAKKGTTPDGWLREYEINWNVAKGDRVFKEFSYDRHAVKLKGIQERPFIRGWDFGYHYPALVIAQFDENERLSIISEFIREDILFDDFLREALSFCDRKFGKQAFYYDFCDPAGAQQTHRSRLTDIEVMAKAGIIARYKRSEEPQRTRLIHLLLSESFDGPGMLIDPAGCPSLVSAFQGGLVYHPQKPEHVKEIHPYIDLFDALGYLILGVVDQVSVEPLYPYRAERPDEKEERLFMETENAIGAPGIYPGEPHAGIY